MVPQQIMPLAHIEAFTQPAAASPPDELELSSLLPASAGGDPPDELLQPAAPEATATPKRDAMKRMLLVCMKKPFLL
jgi:hypothetical protein